MNVVQYMIHTRKLKAFMNDEPQQGFELNDLLNKKIIDQNVLFKRAFFVEFTDSSWHKRMTLQHTFIEGLAFEFMKVG